MNVSANVSGNPPWSLLNVTNISNSSSPSNDESSFRSNGSQFQFVYNISSDSFACPNLSTCNNSLPPIVVDDADNSLWAVGVVFVILASFLSTLGILTQKRAHSISNKCLQLSVWSSGLSGMVAGAVLDLAAFGFAAQSLLAPLGGTTIVFNALLSPFFLGEKLFPTDLIATGIILLGCTFTVVFGDQAKQDFPVETLIEYYQRWDVVLYFLVVAFCLLATFSILYTWERPYRLYLKECEEHYPNNCDGKAHKVSDPSDVMWMGGRELKVTASSKIPQPSSDDESEMTISISATEVSINREAFSASLMQSPLLSTAPTRESKRARPDAFSHTPKIPAMEHREPTKCCIEPIAEVDKGQEMHVMTEEESVSSDTDAEGKGLLDFLPPERHMAHAFLYAALSGTVGAQSVLFGKTVAEFIKNPSSAFGSYELYIVLLLMIFTLILQLRFLNLGLCYHPALLVVPIYQTFWVVVSIMGGGIYFKEFQHFDAKSGIMFGVGVMIAIGGVHFLTYYRAKYEVGSHDSEDQSSSDSGGNIEDCESENKESAEKSGEQCDSGVEESVEVPEDECNQHSQSDQLEGSQQKRPHPTRVKKVGQKGNSSSQSTAGKRSGRSRAPGLEKVEEYMPSHTRFQNGAKQEDQEVFVVSL